MSALDLIDKIELLGILLGLSIPALLMLHFGMTRTQGYKSTPRK